MRAGTRASRGPVGSGGGARGAGEQGCWGVAGWECGAWRRLRRTGTEGDWRGRDLWGRGRALLPVVSPSGPPLAELSPVTGGNVRRQSTSTSRATLCPGASKHRRRPVNVG